MGLDHAPFVALGVQQYLENAGRPSLELALGPCPQSKGLCDSGFDVVYKDVDVQPFFDRLDLRHLLFKITRLASVMPLHPNVATAMAALPLTTWPATSTTTTAAATVDAPD